MLKHDAVAVAVDETRWGGDDMMKRDGVMMMTLDTLMMMKCQNKIVSCTQSFVAFWFQILSFDV